MSLDELPLEDLARGLFPGGASESWWGEAHISQHQPAVVKRIREFKKIAVIYMVRLEVYAGDEDVLHGYQHIYPRHAYHVWKII